MAGIRVTTVRIRDDVYVCSVAGELHVGSTETLDSELETVKGLGGRHVILDLVDVTLLDVAGLELLLAVAEQLRPKGGTLVVVTDDPRKRRLFDVTGSAGQFRVEPSLAGAVGELTGGMSTL
jgi:anti-sigma B factor antagonist